jgi:hypothetical protein
MYCPITRTNTGTHANTHTHAHWPFLFHTIVCKMLCSFSSHYLLEVGRKRSFGILLLHRKSLFPDSLPRPYMYIHTYISQTTRTTMEIYDLLSSRFDCLFTTTLAPKNILRTSYCYLVQGTSVLWTSPR